MVIKVKNQVERLLSDRPELRDSDKKLLLAVWSEQGLDLTEQQRRKFMDCTTAESITRARRALREQYPESEAIDQQRYNNYVNARYSAGETVVDQWAHIFGEEN